MSRPVYVQNKTAILREGNSVFNIQHASLTYEKMLFAFVTSRLQPQGHRLVSLRVKGFKHTFGSQDRLNEKETNAKC